MRACFVGTRGHAVTACRARQAHTVLMEKLHTETVVGTFTPKTVSENEKKGVGEGGVRRYGLHGGAT